MASHHHDLKTFALLAAVSGPFCRSINADDRAEDRVLAILIEAGKRGLSQVSLANASEARPAALSRLIDQMERRGLVVRRSHPFDRRSKIVEVTEAGREQAAARAAQIQSRCQRIFDDFSEDELATLNGSLMRIAEKGEPGTDRPALRAQSVQA